VLKRAKTYRFSTGAIPRRKESEITKKPLTNRAIALFAAIALSACQLPDPYAKDWGLLRVGDSRQQAVHLLGEPSKVTAVEVSVVTVEQCAWKAPGGRTYLAHFVMDRLVAKSVID
jgi:hypothetical protein